MCKKNLFVLALFITSSLGAVKGPLSIPKDFRTPEHWETPVYRSAKGDTDAFGYTWQDAAAGEWIDISGIGTEVTVQEFLMGTYPGDDAYAGSFPMGFEFKYYWYPVESFWIHVNGAISFSGGPEYAPQWEGQTTEIPSSIPPNDLVIAMGGDLTLIDENGDQISGAHIYYWSNNIDSLVVSWVDVPEWQLTGTYFGSHTFQLILTKEDSCITFNYGQQVGELYEGTPTNAIGIENISGEIGLQYRRNVPIDEAITEGLQVKFIPPDSTTLIIHDIATIEACNPGSKGIFLMPSAIYPLWAKARNLGTEEETHFHLICNITEVLKESVLKDSTAVSSLAPAERCSVSFIYWNPLDVGDYAIDAYHNLAEDVNPDNDHKIVEAYVVEPPCTLAYEDGDVEYYHWYYNAGSGIGNEFVPPMYPCLVNAIGMAAYIPADPEDDHLILQVWDGGPDGPENLLFSDTITGIADPGDFHWYWLDVSGEDILIAHDAFYVAYIQYADDNYPDPHGPCFCSDTNEPWARRNWSYHPVYGWSYSGAETRDYFLRAYITTPLDKDASVFSIASPASYISAQEALNPEVVVKNVGAEIVDCSLYITIDSLGTTVYDADTAVEGLAIGVARSYTFAEWSPGGDVGTEYESTAWIKFSGDMNVTNDTLTKTTQIIGTDFVIWNPLIDKSKVTSGEILYDMLVARGKKGAYTNNLLSLIDYLELFPWMFVCCGEMGDKYKIGAESEEAQIIESFLQSGDGRVYLEGGDAWYYDPQHDGWDPNPWFGSSAVEEAGPLDSIFGVSGTPTEGLNFSYKPGIWNNDYIAPLEKGGTIVLEDKVGRGRGINYLTGDYKAWGSCFELGTLGDSATRAALLDTILQFFLQGVAEESGNVAPAYTLFNLTPNPMSHAATISYQIADKAQVSLKVYDILGRTVRTLKDAVQIPGKYNVQWAGRDDNGKLLPNGIYFYRLETGKFVSSKKLILIR